MATFEEALEALLDGKSIEIYSYVYEEITDLHALTISEIQSDSWEIRGYWENCTFEEAVKHLAEESGPIRSIYRDSDGENEIDQYDSTNALHKLCSSELDEQWQRKFEN